MAIIVPQVSPEPIPGVREQPVATLETFGGGQTLEQVGAQSQKVGNAAGEIAAFESIRADQTAHQEATAKLAAIHSDLLTNPKTGLPSYQGVNAMAGHDKLWAEYQKQANSIYESLHGQNQKGAFMKTAVAMGDAFNQHAMAYVNNQIEKHDATTFGALINNQSELAANEYGNDHALQLSYGIVNDAAVSRAKRLGLSEDETKSFMRGVTTKFHETVLSQMVNDPNFLKKAKGYFYANKDEMDVEAQDRIRSLFDVVPKQQDATAKHDQEQFYKNNMRQAMLDMFDGKMSLTEAQRRFRDGMLDKSDYSYLESRMSKPDADFVRSSLISDPETFNEIRQAQLTGAKTPGEIQRMIARGASTRDITPEDGKYLLRVNSENPPSPNDKYIESQANNIRDFASKYYSESHLFGLINNKEKASAMTQSLITDFYSQVDKAKAKGEDVDKIRDEIKRRAMIDRFPGLGNLDSAPDVVIDIKGRVTRLLNPDQHSALKPRYRVVPAGTPTADQSEEE